MSHGDAAGNSEVLKIPKCHIIADINEKYKGTSNSWKDWDNNDKKDTSWKDYDNNKSDKSSTDYKKNYVNDFNSSSSSSSYYTPKVTTPSQNLEQNNNCPTLAPRNLNIF